ncbi:MAG: nucleoside-diphosphate kinase [archaeon]
MIEKTLVLIKPDGVQRGLVGEIITRFERVGFKIIGMKMVYADKEIAGKHYQADEDWFLAVGKKQKDAYAKKGLSIDKTERQIGIEIREFLMAFLSMSPVVALIVEGHNSIAHIRKLCGATSPADAIPGTIRGDLAFDSYQLADNLKRPIQNLIHASETEKDAEREIKVWFKPEEIHAWKRVDEVLLYRKGEDDLQ